jgi:hypothetical protein
MAAKKKSLVSRVVAWVKRVVFLAVVLVALWFGAPIAFAAWRARAVSRAVLG